MKAFVILLLFAIPTHRTVTSLTAPERNATITYVQSLQNADGGFGGAAGQESDLGATSAAIRALRFLGSRPKDLTKCGAFVAQCFRDAPTNAFAPKPKAQPDVRSNAMGVMALEGMSVLNTKQVQGASTFLEKNSKSFEDIRIAVAAFEAAGTKPHTSDQWIAAITKNQNDDGTFGTGGPAARETGSAVVALLRLGIKPMKADAIITTLKEGQQPDGGFSRDNKVGSDLETSYRVMRAFHMLKIKPDVPTLRAFIRICRNADGGYGVAPGQPSSPGSAYFALTILSWID